MRSTTKWIVLAAAMLVLSGSGQARADLVYYLNNTPAYQNGWSLSGSITTDGTIGAITTANVESWTWTITQNGASYTYSDASPFYDFVVGNYVEATSTQILLLVPPVDSDPAAYLQLRSGDYYQGIPTLSWLIPPDDVLWYGNGGNTDRFWAYVGSIAPDTSWVIATAQSVPEPSSFVYFGIGGLTCLGYARSIWRGRKVKLAV
jgi:hypothetical protein